MYAKRVENAILYFTQEFTVDKEIHLVYECELQCSTLIPFGRGCVSLLGKIDWDKQKIAFNRSLTQSLLHHDETEVLGIADGKELKKKIYLFTYLIQTQFVSK